MRCLGFEEILSASKRRMCFVRRGWGKAGTKKRLHVESSQFLANEKGSPRQEKVIAHMSISRQHVALRHQQSLGCDQAPSAALS